LIALVAFLTGAVVALLLTPVVRDWACGRGWLDRPDGARKSHSVAVPRIGGLAVYAAFVVAFALLMVLSPSMPEDTADLQQDSVHLMAACGLVMAVGLADDLRSVKPWVKILVQALAGAYLYANGYRLDAVTNPWGTSISLGPLSFPLTLLWFVGMSNAFNLIDGLDGLAAGVGFLATLSIALAAALSARWGSVALTLALAGPLLGFLRYNFSPASIFLGDSGSLFVGFALAAFSVPPHMKATAVIAVATPLFALALPILDVALAVWRRLRARRNIFEADRDHIHHKLLARGHSRRSAVIVLWGVAALCGSLSLVSMALRARVAGATVLVGVLLAVAGLHHLGYLELGALARLRSGQRNSTGDVGLRGRLLRAESFGELWDVYVDTASAFGLTSVELELDPEVQRLVLDKLPAARPRHSFPVWGTGGRNDSPCWSLNLTLSRGPVRLGVLLLKRARLGAAPQVHPALIELSTTTFPERLAALLFDGPAAIALTPVPGTRAG
jgi:UDP-GlcNAc:undecaprenyl-phosphate GlcNAc-1-phosphate transferase